MEKLKYEYLLPIGTIVKVKNVEQKLMIIGVLQTGKAVQGKTFDYVAVPYPEGLHDFRLNIGFDHNDIETVVFRGYENDERKAFIILISAMEKCFNAENK